MQNYEKLEKIGEDTYRIVIKAKNREFVHLKRVRLEDDEEGELIPTILRLIH